jgi:hypothetical protein
MEMKIAAELIMVSRDTSEFYRDIPSGIFPQKQKNKGRIGKKDFRFWEFRVQMIKRGCPGL